MSHRRSIIGHMIPPDPEGRDNGILASVPPECHGFARPLLPPIESPGPDLIEVSVDGLWLGPITITFMKKRIRNRNRGTRLFWLAYRADRAPAASLAGQAG
jgi:hypothetical protein